jgi:hypothetical protein
MNARVIPVFNQVRDPLTEVLAIYVQWTRREDFGNQHRHREGDHNDREYAYIQADINTAEAVHTMLWELKEIYRWAIQKRCGISSVWRFPHVVFADALDIAEAALIARMKENFATRNYFK